MHGNTDAGLSLAETSYCVIYNNRVVNQAIGIRIIIGGEDNIVWGNVFEDNTGKLYMLYVFYYFDSFIL